MNTAQQIIKTTPLNLSAVVALVQSHNFVPYYQPIVKNHNAQAYECLARLSSEDGDILNPGQFLPQVEEAGLMPTLDTAVMKMAVSQMGDWKKRLGVRVCVSVNATFGTLRSRSYASAVHSALRRNNVFPKQLTVEVVEPDSFWLHQDAIKTLAELHHLGVRLAIDDCPDWLDLRGLLTWLTEVPVGFISTLKVDRTVVRQFCEGNPLGRLQLPYLIEFAHCLGMSVVAEGVEEESHINQLLEVGVDRLQGYCFGRPVPAEEVDICLRTNILTRSSSAKYILH